LAQAGQKADRPVVVKQILGVRPLVGKLTGSDKAKWS